MGGEGTRREVLEAVGAIGAGGLWGSARGTAAPFARAADPATIDGTVGETVYLPATSDATVTGTSTANPGTEFVVVLLESDDPFARAPATVADDGTWSATFDLSGMVEGREFTIAVTRDGERLATAPGVIGTPSAAVSFGDQTARESGTTVVVDSATLDEGGFISVREESATGRIVGVSGYLDAGVTYSDLEIRLDEGVSGRTDLVAVAHLDTDRDRTFDFADDGSEDRPYVADGRPVADGATVTGPTPTSGPPTPTPRPPTSTPRPPTPSPGEPTPEPPATQSADLAVGGTGGLLGLWLLRRARSRLRNEEDDDRDRSPVAIIGYLPEEPAPWRPVLFDGSASFDPGPDGRVADYRWTVGDRETRGPRFVHAFARAGEFDVTLKVTNDRGKTDERTETVAVGADAGEFALVRVHPDAPGDDRTSLHREYLVFENAGEAALELGGWTVHDAAEDEGRVSEGEHTFAFDDGFELASGATVAVHTGPRPEGGADLDGTGGERHVFWGKRSAVWNNEADVVVVEDGGERPVLATRYERNETGGYDVEALDVEVLEDWFPTVVVSEREGVPPVRVSLDAGAGRRAVRAVVEFVAGGVFLRGPRGFLASWATVAGFLLASSLTWFASTSAGLVSPSVEPIVPLLGFLAAPFALGVGVVGMVLGRVVSALWTRLA